MLYSILIGVIIFWITSKIMDLKGWGLIMNTLFVIAGSAVGSKVLGLISLPTSGFTGDIISGVVGCCVVVAIIKFIKG